MDNPSRRTPSRRESPAQERVRFRATPQKESPKRDSPQKKSSQSPTQDKIHWLPTLYTFDNLGKVRMFKAGYSKGVYHSATGLVYLKDGSPGTITPKTRKVEQKNNTSSPLEAAKLFATQKWEKKQRIDRYRQCENAPEPEDLEAWREDSPERWPAVSKDWKKCNPEDLECSVNDPWYCQAKIDGDRHMCWLSKPQAPVKRKLCFEGASSGSEEESDYRVKMYSRNLLEKVFLDVIRDESGIVLDYISERWPDLGNVGLDGEVFSPSMRHHQDSRSRGSRTVNRHPDEDSMVFFIFDIMEYTLPFKERAKIVNAISSHFAGSLSRIAFLGTSILTNPEDIPIFVEYCAEASFDEGIILRRGDLLYSKKKKHKHCDMVKLKKFEDTEFEVIGFKEGQGDHEGCVVWHLRDPDDPDVTFWSSQLATIEQQKEYFQRADEYIGRLATVKFQSRSKDNIPVLPGVKYFRDEGDLP